MLKRDFTRILIDSAVRRTLKEMQESPEREIRNLVDMGLQFASGRFQSRLLKQVRKMLENPQSAYYDLVKRVTSTVDHEIIATFGVNLGYNSCTKGAKRIREREADKGFNIPWTLNLMLNGEKLRAEPDFYPSLLRQGMELGIYTYLLFVAEGVENVIPVIEGAPDCAFLLFLHGTQVSNPFIQRMQAIKNVMVSIYADGDMEPACEKLRESGLLYSVYQRYTEADRERILSGEWLGSLSAVQPAFAFLWADFSCPPQTQQDIYHYITGVRDGQEYPLILMDMKQDSLRIDQVISEGECLAGFDRDGSLRTYEGFRREDPYNIFAHPLEEILRRASPKLP